MILNHKLIFIACLCLLYLAGSGCTPGKVEPYARTDLPTRLTDVPVYLDRRSKNLDSEKGAWSSPDLAYTSQGQISGRVEFSIDRSIDHPISSGSGEPEIEYLFIQQIAHYNELRFGDFPSQVIGDFVPIQPQESNIDAATFSVDLSLELPPMQYLQQKDVPLASLELQLVWIRLYPSNNEYLTMSLRPCTGLNSQRQVNTIFMDQDPQPREGCLCRTEYSDDNSFAWWAKEQHPIPTMTPRPYPLPELPTLAPLPYPYPSPIQPTEMPFASPIPPEARSTSTVHVIEPTLVVPAMCR
ncbi:MAG: hypothetical protein EHM70_00320 [Chloroflexota bacterium]|nr:MAG: hypothetical protein EHM70_00320 [Chloroflexota bacterium]